MHCPVCKKVRLIRNQYEGVKVRHCPECEGHLVREPRISAIRNKLEKSDEAFMEEIASINARDNNKELRCPACTRSMSKRRKEIGPEHYYIDQCTNCDEIWFDGGELAKMQLQYEESEQGAEMFRFRERLANLEEAERLALDAKIASLSKKRPIDRSKFALLAWLLLGR